MNLRLPLFIFRKQDRYFFQTQDEVDKYHGLGIYTTYSELEKPDAELLGAHVCGLLRRFEEISDYTEEQFSSLMGMTIEEYNKTKRSAEDIFGGVHPFRAGDEYDICVIKYFSDKNSYSFYPDYAEVLKGKTVRTTAAEPFGEPGLLTFETTLEFTEYPQHEELGKMVMEALDRSRQLTEKALGNESFAPERMNFKLQPYMNKSRTPLVIFRKRNCYSFQTQDEVARSDGFCAGAYVTYSKLENPDEALIGAHVRELVRSFEEISDYTEEQIFSIIGMKIDEYEKDWQEFFGKVHPFDAGDEYDICSIRYSAENDLYTFYSNYAERYRGKKIRSTADEPCGQPGLLTFDTALEFNKLTGAEDLGKMVIEALDRSRLMTDKSLGNKFPDADIELMDGRTLTVGHPRDRHFGDFDDYGVAEIYKAYGYLPGYDSEPTAYFFIAMAAEMNEDLAEENVRGSWEKMYGKADSFDMEAVNYGIYRMRAEMKCRKCHRISYYVQSEEGLVLECGMEVRTPGRRKKLDENLSGLFEQFAASGRFKQA